MVQKGTGLEVVAQSPSKGRDDATCCPALLSLLLCCFGETQGRRFEAGYLSIEGNGGLLFVFLTVMLRNNSLDFPNSIERESPAPTKILAEADVALEPQNAEKTPCHAQKATPSTNPQGLQLVRTFAPDEEKQLCALRLLSDAPGTVSEGL